MAICRHEDVPWVVSNDSRSPRAQQNSESMMMDADERNRLGTLKLATSFNALFNCRLAHGNLIAGMLELYEGSIMRFASTAEIFLLAQKGAIKLTLDDEVQILHQGDAASLRPKESCSVERANPGENADDLYSVLLYVRQIHDDS